MDSPTWLAPYARSRAGGAGWSARALALGIDAGILLDVGQPPGEPHPIRLDALAAALLGKSFEVRPHPGGYLLGPPKR